MPFQIAKLDIKDPLKCLQSLRKTYKNCFLLESATRGDLRLSRYSFLGFDPEIIIEIKGNQAKINGKKTTISTLAWKEHFGKDSNSDLNITREERRMSCMKTWRSN